MLQGVNFISTGQAGDKEKKTGRKGEGDFELSKPVDMKDKQKKVVKRKDKIKQKKKPPVFEKNKQTPGVIKKEKKKRGGWWQRFFKPSVKQPVLKDVEKKAKPEQESKISGASLENLKDFKEVPREEKVKGRMDVRGGEEVGELVERKKEEVDKQQAEAAVLSRISPSSRETKEKEPDFDINLMPQEKKHISLGQRVWLIFLIFIILVGAELYGYSVLKKDNSQELNKIGVLSGQSRELRQMIDKVDNGAEQALKWYVKAGAAQGLFRQHRWWSKFFIALESNTHINTYYTLLDVGDKEKVSLRGVAKDYKSLAQAMLGYEDANDFMQEYEVSGVNVEERQEDEENEQAVGPVNFLLSFSIKPDFLIFNGLK